MNELNERIIKKFKDNIAISNLKEEYTMKKGARKQVLVGTTVIMLMLSGSFITVNATTNGQLVETVKDTIKIIFVKDNKEEKEQTSKEGEYSIISETTNNPNMESALDKGYIEIDTNIIENSQEGTITVDLKK